MCENRFLVKIVLVIFVGMVLVMWLCFCINLVWMKVGVKVCLFVIRIVVVSSSVVCLVNCCVLVLVGRLD